MKKLKRILSSLLTVAMIATTAIPSVVFATDSRETGTTENPIKRAKINMVFLGKSAADDIWDLSDDTLTITTPPTDANTWTANPTTGTIFWVGLTLSDMAKMDATAGDGADATDLTYASNRKVNGQKITTVSHFTRYTSAASNDSLKNGGIFFIGAGIEYASKYVKPVYITDNDTEEDANNVAKNTIGNTIKKIESRYADGSYTIASVNTAANITSDTTREPSTIKSEDQPKLFYMNMESGEGVGKKIFGFKENINDAPLCILAIPFRLVEMPPKGTKLFQAALNPANFEIQTGASSTGQDIWKASWNASREVLTDRNLKNHFDYTGDLELFAADQATISIKTNVDGTETTLTDTITAKETDTTVKYSDISGKLTAPTAPSGKYFAGWAASLDGAVLRTTDDVDDTIDITTEGENKSVTVYAVFETEGVKTITSVSGATDNAAVEGGSIPFRSTMMVSGTMNSGGSIPTANNGNKIGNNGLKLYRQTATGWEEVTADTKYNAGNNVFTVATGTPGTEGAVQLKTSANATTFTVSAKTKATLSVPATTNKTFGESAAITATATETTSGNALPTTAYEVLYKVSTANDSTYTKDVPKNKGTYTVKVQLTTTGNNAGNKTYSATAATGTITIAQKAITVEIPTVAATYGDAEANRKVTPTFTGNVAAFTAGTDYKVEYKAAGAADTAYSTTVPTNKGKYDVKVTLLNGNYSTTSTLTKANALDIAQKAIAVNVNLPTDLVYNSEAKGATVASGTVGVTLAATTDYSVAYKKVKADNSEEALTGAPTEAGNYKVIVTMADDSNYSATEASVLTKTYTIAKKKINKAITIDLGEEQGVTAKTVNETVAVDAADGALAADAGNTEKLGITVKGTVDVSSGGTKEITAPAAPAEKIALVGTSAGNYELQAVTAQASVTNLPRVSDLSATAKGTIEAAKKNGTSDWKAADQKTLAQLIALLPGDDTVTDDKGNTHDVTITWEVVPAGTTLEPKGGTYTFKGTVTSTDNIVINDSTNKTVQIEVKDSTITANPTITAPAAVAKGTEKTAAAFNLPTDGKVTVDGVDVTYEITNWTFPDDFDTSVAGATATVTGTIKYDENAKWVTIPTDTTVTTTVSIQPDAPKPDATGLTAASQKAIDDLVKTYKAADKKTLDDFKTALDALTLKVTDGTNEYNVTAEWSLPEGTTLTEKGGTYPYTAALTTTEYVNIPATIVPAATFTVNASTITANPTITAPAAVAKGTEKTAAALGLPADGKVTVDGEDVTYTIEWTIPDDFDTSVAGATATATGRIKYDENAKWVTLPDDTTVTTTVSVQSDIKATGWKEAVDIDKSITAADANNTKAYLVDAIPTEFDTTAVAVDKDGNPYTITLNWALKAGTEYTPKSGVYEYTTTPSSTEVDVTDLPKPTAKITVTPVNASFDKSIFDALTVAKNADNSTFEKLGLAIDGTATLDPAVEGKTVTYKVNWTPESTKLDTAKSGAKQDFEGTIDFTGAPEWVTLPTELKGTKPVQVKSVSYGGGGGGSTPSYAVTFSAGAHGKIVSGKASLRISSGQVIKELPVVEAFEGYKFVGWSQDGGKTIIDLADNPIKSESAFIAVYEEDVKETPAPTATPAIPTTYTKPYATGYDGDVFLPENNITRAELATMIARLIYGDELPDGIYRASFSDIPSDAWYGKYVGYLESFGILDGYDEDGIMVFKPDQTITRAEMATVITRAQKFAVENTDSIFWDVEADYWATGYITTLASRNIITGYADGSFGPTNPLTRAEAVVIINRLLDPSTAIEEFIPVDISNHWAEKEIILAVNERKVNGTGEEAAPEQEATPAPEATPEATEEAKAEGEATQGEATTEPTATPAA